MKTVLIADDSIFMQKWLTKIIQSNGMFQVVATAQNGLDAVKQYKLTDPDIALLDIVMPDASGVTALKEIIKYDKNAYVIMCSSLGADSHVKEAMKLGAKDFIVKPYFHCLVEKMKKVSR
ncbi:response regulator [Aliibacillus thermotolerans]|uniref:Response regulator n=1 Tax=Aliibacillus thermotolerans TaxID=1834418 RepID=A0ABW0U8S5_9BACI|nr:response regulator [Aliibacillus thermotolerans]MDA3128773.1 response regulator [Aliibacillus thermotolerans]